MRSSLLYLKSIVAKSDMENVVVIGVICNGNGHLSIRFYFVVDCSNRGSSGTSMTVLQAWNLSSNLLFFKENEFVVTLDTLPLLIQTCWRLKVLSTRLLIESCC